MSELRIAQRTIGPEVEKRVQHHAAQRTKRRSNARTNRLLKNYS
jgi:hypothetical protein